jgi:hypothetical protein
MTDYLESCVRFIEMLMSGLETDFGVSTKRITYRDRQNEDKPLREAMYLEQGVWHVDTALTMCPESAYRLRQADFTRCYYPRQTVVLPLVIKKVTGDVFVVGLQGYPQQFTLSTTDKTNMTAFYQFIFTVLFAYYKNIFSIILEHNESPRTLEFKYLENYLL